MTGDGLVLECRRADREQTVYIAGVERKLLTEM